VLIDHAQQVGAPIIILIIDALLRPGHLARCLFPRRYPGETFAATVIADALVLAIVAEHEQ
jgi:hypothetical protein